MRRYRKQAALFHGTDIAILDVEKKRTAITVSSTAWNGKLSSTSNVASSLILEYTDQRVGAWSRDAKVCTGDSDLIGIANASWDISTVACVTVEAHESNGAIRVEITICHLEKVPNTKKTLD